MKKWMIGLMCGLVGVTAAMGALTSPATLPMEYAGESGWTTANLDALTGWDATGLGTVYAAPNASCKFDSAGDKIIIYFDSAPGEIVYSARRSDKTALTGPYEATLQESVDTSTWTDVRSFDGSEFEGTLVTFTNALSSSSRYVKFEYITKPSGQNFGIGYVKITTGGPAVFSVSFDQPDGLTVEQGSTGVITAIPANGTGPYTYAWTTDLGASHYTAITNEFTIGATAPIGDYSAEVVATDSTSAKVTNSINFSVVAPVEKYAITITTPVNGSVTTTPATEAAAGATVTVNATPASGYAVGSIVVNGGAVAVSGTTFTMPAQAVTVTVTFAVEEAPPAGSYIVDFEGEGETKAAYASATISLNGKNWDMTEAMTGATVDSDWFNGTRSARLRGYGPSSMTMLEDLTDGLGTISFNYRRYGTDGQVDWKVEYSTDAGGSWTQIGSDFTALASDDVQTFSETVNVSGNVRVRIKRATETGTTNKRLNIDDITMTSGGPTVFGVSFDKTSGFTVETGSSATITATAVNGTPGYTYAWTTTMDAGDYSVSGAAFTIAAAATVGNYSAQVVATDNASQSVTNSLTFSVVPVATKYAITITAPVNGSVTTTPATEAAAGATVTVNATPASGYAVDTIVVSGGIGTLPGTTFTMPAQPVTVTVTFMEYTAPDVLITFEDGTLPTAYAANTATLEDGKVWSTERVVRGNLENDKKIDTLSARLYPQTGTNAVLQQTEAYAEPITKLSFSVASYGTDNMANVVLTAEVSADGSTWEVVKTLTAAAEITDTLVEHVVETIPANAVYVRFVATAAAASNKRINLDNIGVDFGAATFSVSVDKSNGFTVQEGSSATITATAANGTTPYTYAWTSTLGGAYYTDAGNVFTILSTAPVGNYSATVTATDATEATTQKTVTFSVVGLPPGQPAVVITGTLTGTVGVQMALNISVTNETALDWGFVLTDPDSEPDYTTDYSGFPPVWALTPAKEGTYTLTVTATTGSGSFSNTVNLVISAASTDPEIPAITFVAGTGFTFEIPSGSALVRVEGADTTVTGQAFTWTTLASPADYEVSGSTVTIKSGAAAQRLIRVWFN